MGNTLTNLIPHAYRALDVVSREMVGFIPAVGRDAKADQIAENQTLYVEVTPPNTAGDDITPGMSLPTAAYQTIANVPVTMAYKKFYPFSWTGEEQNSVNQGPGFLTIKEEQIAQAFRAAINGMEAVVAAVAYKGASRAYGTPASTPFASDLSDTAQLRKILDDNGAPKSDRHLVIDTTAGAKVRTLTQLTNANQSGDTSFLRQGELLNVHGFTFRESAQVQSHTKGTGGSWVFNGTHAIGVTTLTLKSGSNRILAGDVLTFQNDTNKYVVKTALSGSTVVIAEPGLRIQHVDGETVTVGNSYTANVGFCRNAILLATRLPAVPAEGDLAIDRFVITDELSGISFEIAAYPGYRMVTYHVSIVYGAAVVKAEHIATLLG